MVAVLPEPLVPTTETDSGGLMLGKLVLSASV